jgi:peptidoglycan hydrolase-like protein with peptidoglycan-binding domain
MKKYLLLLVLGLSTPAWSALPQQNSAEEANLTKAPIVWPTFRPGRKPSGKEFDTSVAAVQYLLRGRGFYHSKIDGIYGSKTVAAVKAFQKSKGLRPDGIAGEQTLPKLLSVVKRGSRGDAVRAAQILARKAVDHVGGRPNIGLVVDGIYGASTQEAIKVAESCANQLVDRLVVDGVMGKRSWCVMLGGHVVGDEG